MKLFNSIVLTLVGLLMLTTSCQNRKSYSDYLKDERKAIDLFIAKNNFKVIKDFPADGKFKDNEFYKDPYTGVYFNIISRGDTSKLQLRQKVYVRFKGLQSFMTDDTIKYTNHHSKFPEQLTYIGPVTSSTANIYLNGGYEQKDTKNAGWAVPLPYVGHTGKVKMIVPFDFGSTYDRDQNLPTYYEQVQYRFDNQW